jgi:hypothetical protein
MFSMNECGDTHLVLPMVSLLLEFIVLYLSSRRCSSNFFIKQIIRIVCFVNGKKFRCAEISVAKILNTYHFCEIVA